MKYSIDIAEVLRTQRRNLSVKHQTFSFVRNASQVEKF